MSLLKDARASKMLAKWAPLLESGHKMSEEMKLVTAQLLENTRKDYARKGMILEGHHGAANEYGAGQVRRGDVAGTSPISKSGSAGYMKGKNGYDGAIGTDPNADFYLPQVVMPILRRIMPDLIANDLVAVQPLTGPMGYAVAYRPMVGNREVGFNTVDARYTGASDAAGSIYSSDVTGSDAWAAYAGTEQIWNGVGADLGKGVGEEFLHLEDYPHVSFGLVKSAVEAKTRRLAAEWSPELQEDVEAMHGLNVEKEMINTLTFEVGAEIDRQIVSEMVKAAIVGGSVTEWKASEADGIDQMGRLATLLTQINIEANQIALRTRRGNANFVITTPRVCALLQQLSMNKFTSFKTTGAIPTVPDTGVGALAKVGLLNDDSMLLIRDSYAAQGTVDYLLMGYKGKTAGDSGIIYCPYIPLQLQKVFQPHTFTPSIGARTRYGIMSNPWDAKNYYSFMKVNVVGQKYSWNNTERTFIADPSKITNGTLPEA